VCWVIKFIRYTSKLRDEKFETKKHTSKNYYECGHDRKLILIYLCVLVLH